MSMGELEITRSQLIEIFIMLPRVVNNLINQFARLPGIGQKTASRLVFYLLKRSQQNIMDFSQALIGLANDLHYCQQCYNITDNSADKQEPILCNICRDSRREHSKIMVIEEPLDLVALAKTGYNGLYHILGGAISPIDGIGPEQLKIKELMERLQKIDSPVELILATNPTLEGEATAMYISQRISNLKTQNSKLSKIEVTRLASGLPVGGDLEYADEITLTRSLEGRERYK